MFTQYFGLKFNPFGKEINADCLYESSDMKELSARLKYLQTARGIGLIVGESGTGKSTSLRKFVSSLNTSLYKPCYFALSTLTVKDFYQALASMLGETPSYRKVTIFNQIQGAISSYYYDQKITPFIILDEIQMASNDILEDLSMIFNFRMDSENPFILILSGQPHIRNKLALNINNSLRQRITIKYMFQGLKKEELPQYIQSRLKISGSDEELFTASAIDAIYGATKGFPRLVNNLATACSKKQRLIDEEAVFQAQNEINI